jgi:hypothetical protein
MLAIGVMTIPMMLSGCIASKIITAPIRAAGTVVETAVDATTQTQSEKEEDVGRRVLAERKQHLKACLDEAEIKAERRDCNARYDRDD